jgi:monothiol glutaredoxin
MSELRDRIKEIIDTEDVVVFMKGTPQWVMCGNSMRALDALRAVEAPIAAVDVLPNPEYRKELTAISGWPTIPQVFVKGELIGGADIVQELVVTGDLQQKLADALGEDYRRPGAEKTLALAAA